MVARVAIARHLLRIIFYMLRDNSDYYYREETLFSGKKKRLEMIARLHERRFREATKTNDDIMECTPGSGQSVKLHSSLGGQSHKTECKIDRHHNRGDLRQPHQLCHKNEVAFYAKALKIISNLLY